MITTWCSTSGGGQGPPPIWSPDQGISCECRSSASSHTHEGRWGHSTAQLASTHIQSGHLAHVSCPAVWELVHPTALLLLRLHASAASLWPFNETRWTWDGSGSQGKFHFGDECGKSTPLSWLTDFSCWERVCTRDCWHGRWTTTSTAIHLH